MSKYCCFLELFSVVIQWSWMAWSWVCLKWILRKGQPWKPSCEGWTTWHPHRQSFSMILLQGTPPYNCNRPNYCYMLSNLAFDWNWGWRWHCFDKHLSVIHVYNSKIYIWNEWFLLKRGQLQARFHLKGQDTRYTTVKWSIDIVTVDDRFASNRTNAVIVTWCKYN